jgi:hypothetical protein
VKWLPPVLIGIGFGCIVAALVVGGDLTLYLIGAAVVALFAGLAVAALSGR